MLINLRESNEVRELVLNSLKMKKINISEINDLQTYFNVQTKVIKYTASHNGKVTKGLIYTI